MKLARFIGAFTRLVERAAGREPVLLAEGRALLAALVREDDWLPAACAQPDAKYYRQYPLHVDPLGRFSVVSFVWGPGQKTPVHDHTVWGLIGVLRGGERCERFDAGAPGQPMRRLGEGILQPGDVDAVSPTVGDIHRVANLHDDRVSISIHVYGGDIGRIERHAYDPPTGAAKAFVSGYSTPPPA